MRAAVREEMLEIRSKFQVGNTFSEVDQMPPEAEK